MSPTVVKHKAPNSRRNTRERLLDAGLELFAQHGVDATGIRDLEEHAGLKAGSGSFYRHFASKEEVFDEVIEREVVRIRSQFDLLQRTIEGSLGDSQAELRLNIRSRLVGLEFMTKFIAILGRERSRAPNMVRLVSDVLVNTGHELEAEKLKAKMDRGEIVETNPKALAVVISNAVIGFFLTKMYFGGITDEVDDNAFIDTLVTLLLKK